MSRILLAGATGLVGSAVLDAATDDSQVTTVGRRPTGRVADEIITGFSTPTDLPQADVAICALGTTIAVAGSREAFRAVDQHAVITFAEAAQAAGVRHFLVVTAVGSNARSAVFYSRVKGEVERDLEAMKFDRLDIAQPGLLLGPRAEKRPGEALMQRLDPLLRLTMKGPLDRYAGIRADTVATALLALSQRADPGVFRHENRALHTLAGD